MSVTAAIIAGAASIAAAGIGAASASNQQKSAQRRMQEALDAEARRNKQHYDLKYYDDATQRADNVRALNIAQDRLRRQVKSEEGREAVMGGTNASGAAAKEKASMAYADAVSNIAANADAQRTQLKEAQFKNEQEIASKRASLDYQASQNKISNIQTAVNMVGTAANAVGAAFDGANSAKTTTDVKAANGVQTSPTAQQTANQQQLNNVRDTVASNSLVNGNSISDARIALNNNLKPRNIWERGGFYGK